MIVLLVKITLLLALALGLQALLRGSSAAIRHLICVCALAGVLLLPLTLLAPFDAPVFRITTLSIAGSNRAVVAGAGHPALLRTLAGIWMTGAMLLLLRIAAGYFAVSHLLRTATALDEVYPVPVFFADISVPVVTGLLRPVILLPRGAEQWNTSHLEAALRHELKHVERFDLWTILPGHLACAAYWFHPLVWLAAARMREEQEAACDDAVLAAGFDPASYAEALVAAARNITSTRLIGCHMLTKHTLKSRIARLFDNGLVRIPSRVAVRATAAASITAIIVIGMLAGPGQARADDERIYKVGGSVTAPKVLSRVDPDYTPEAKADKVEGAVVLKCVIGTDGAAKDIEVMRSIDAGLEQKAIEALQLWHFQPGAKDGQPVQVRAVIEMNFRLN